MARSNERFDDAVKLPVQDPKISDKQYFQERPSLLTIDRGAFGRFALAPCVERYISAGRIVFGLSWQIGLCAPCIQRFVAAVGCPSAFSRSDWACLFRCCSLSPVVARHNHACLLPGRVRLDSWCRALSRAFAAAIHSAECFPACRHRQPFDKKTSVAVPEPVINIRRVPNISDSLL